MGIKATNLDDFTKALAKRANLIEKATIENLKYLGEQVVKHARDYPGSKDGGFDDQTGNLRSSIGYVVVANGKIVRRNFEQVGEDSTGKLTGLRFARSIAEKYTKGYVVIVVAGMNYAAAVEAKGRNVLQASKQLCEEKMPELKKRIIEALGKMK